MKNCLLGNSCLIQINIQNLYIKLNYLINGWIQMMVKVNYRFYLTLNYPSERQMHIEPYIRDHLGPLILWMMMPMKNNLQLLNFDILAK